MNNRRKSDCEQILALFDQGLEIKDIAIQTKSSAASVSRITHENGRSAFLRRYPQSGKWDREGMLKDYQDQMPVEELCKKHNISMGHLHQLRKKAGMPVRPKLGLIGKKNPQ